MFAGTGTVPSGCVVVSEVSEPANAQLGIVMSEMEALVGSETGAAMDVHAGTSLETVTVMEGVSVNMLMLAVSEVV